jgi:hypothetical protein
LKKMIDLRALSRRKIMGIFTIIIALGLAFYLPGVVGHSATRSGSDGENGNNNPKTTTTTLSFPCNEPALAGTTLASTGAKVPISYFGPAPSNVDPTLVGPFLLLKSGTVDLKACTITIPLYLGHMKDGRTVWYVLTDTNDKGTADLLGILFSPKLNYLNAAQDGTPLYRTASLGPNGDVIFDQGTVDFSPNRVVVPGPAPNFFPPTTATPGSVGSKDYSPIFRFSNNPGVVFNAPIVAFNVDATELNQFCNGNVDHGLVLDNVVKICPDQKTVTLKLVPSFSFGRPTLYIAIESSNPMIAAIEGDTSVPLLSKVTTGLDDGAFSPIERLFPIVNGQMGVNNPSRQGLDSALAGEGAPLTVLGGIPTDATDYSPLWDLNPAVWNQTAVDNHFNGRLTGEFEILGLVAQGWMTGLNGGPFGSSGIINNCPIAFRLL